MCGFLGVLNNSAESGFAIAKRALTTLAHRGPDAGGEWCEGGIFLGHRRLSIIDLATGDQPMQTFDGRYVIFQTATIRESIHVRNELHGVGCTIWRRCKTQHTSLNQAE